MYEIDIFIQNIIKSADFNIYNTSTSKRGMGLLNDITNFINSLGNYEKIQVEKTKAQAKKDKMKKLARENRELKKALSKGQMIGIAGIVVTFASIFIGYYLFAYFPIHSSS